ncbi:DUF899 family protein [Streptomyces sp. NPDC032472]|uniref:DUF899 family protein n=1 Tax=Streptomyces sp. NPDC032472 TaxID=3155018 RepID=UPI0033DD5389
MAGCPSCSAIADGFDGSVIHLANHDVTLCAVPRAPIEIGGGPGHAGSVRVAHHHRDVGRLMKDHRVGPGLS